MLHARACVMTIAAASCLAFSGADALAAGGKSAPEPRGQRRLTSSPAYVPAPTLSAPLTSGYRFAGLLVVDVGFDVPDAKLRARVERMQPRLTDALRTALADYASTRFHVGAAPDADKIARTLQAATDRALAEPGARVLLANVMVQQSR